MGYGARDFEMATMPAARMAQRNTAQAPPIALSLCELHDTHDQGPRGRNFRNRRHVKNDKE